MHRHGRVVHRSRREGLGRHDRHPRSSDGGNIFDAAGLAAIAALRTAVVPAERFDVGEDHTLKVNGTPIMASFKRAGGRFVYDPSEEEELGGDERIHITRRRRPPPLVTEGAKRSLHSGRICRDSSGRRTKVQ